MHRLLLGAAAAGIFVLALRELKTVLVPLAFAAFLFYLAEPMVRWLARRGLPRLAAVALVLLAGAAAFGGALYFVGSAAAALTQDAPRFERQLDALLGPERARRLVSRLPQQAPGPLSAAGSLGAFGGAVLLVFAYLAFLLAGAPRSRLRWRRAFPERAAAIISALEDVEEELIRYFWLTTAVSAGTSVLVWAVLAGHGVRFAAFWAFLNFLAQFVPNVGPLVASVPPVMMAWVDGGPGPAASTAGFLLALQFLIGNFVEPKVIGQGVRLDPVFVLLGIVFFGWLWGVAGAFLAVPLLIAVKLGCERVKDLKPVAGLLQGTEEAGSRSS